MDEWLKVLVLGIVQGITEYLPISSTGHLIVVASFVDLQSQLRGTFEVFIQIGSVFAVMGYYRAALWHDARHILSDKTVQARWLAVFVAFLPAAAIGFVFNDWIDEVLFNPLNVAIALIVGGVLFLIVERPRPAPTPATPDGAPVAIATDTPEAQTVTLRQAFLIGCWQVLALFPGMSRSGMSIVGGMSTGLTRMNATQFSFYLAIPTLGIATVYKFLKEFNALQGDAIMYLIGGAIVSAIVSWFAIAWLLRYLARNNFVPFGVYRIIIGILILVLIAGNIISV